MKKQSAVGLFFSMFLRAAVVILGLVILVFGVALVSKYIKINKGKSDTPATTVSPSVLTEADVVDDLLTAEPTTTEMASEDTTELTEEAPELVTSFDKVILVLNSTDVTGLAGRWCAKLNEHGYANTSASDFYDQQTNTRIISTVDGVGRDLLQYFNGASYEVGVVTQGTSASTDGVDIVIIIGTNDSDQ